METFLKFLGEHMALVVVILVGIFALAAFVIIKGFSFETKSGNIIRIGGISKNNELFVASKKEKQNKESSLKESGTETKESNKKEELKNFLLINNLVNTWRNRLYTKLEKTRNGLVSDCIRHADSLINKNMNDIKRKYIEKANENNKLNTPESNYQTTIFNLSIDRASEDIKSFLYEVIREDHFSSKTEEEIEQINENCITKIDETLSDNISFNISMIKELKKDCYKNIKNMSNDIILVSSKKYEILKKYKSSFIKESQSGMRDELKTKFGFLLSDCDLETLIEYDE